MIWNYVLMLDETSKLQINFQRRMRLMSLQTIFWDLVAVVISDNND